MVFNNHKRIISWTILILIIVFGLVFSRIHIIVNAEENLTSLNLSENTTQNTTDEISQNITANITTNTSEEISIINSSLIILDSSNYKEIYENESVNFYANYTYENGTIEGRCIIDILQTQEEMIYNSTSKLYNYTKIFLQSGNYSYEINCSKEGFTNQSETSTIQILPILINSTNNTIIDNDNDGYSNITDCNDNNPNINPGKKEILYNGLDDDCNPSTLDYLIFNVNTDKQVYSTTETVRISIEAQNNSDTYITINTPTNVSYIYIFSNGSYPVTQEFSLTGLAGTYGVEAINYYENYTNQKNIPFTVQSSMNVEIETNVSEVYEKERIHFKAVVTGATGNVNLIWKMDDNKEIYQSEFDYNYSNAREYNVVLLATDQGGNQVIKTKKILVNKQYFLKVKVVDNSTNEILPNATVKLDSISQKVNSTGEVEYKITNNTYELRVSSDNYYSYQEDIKINNSLIFTVKLVKREEEVSPIISIISPQNNTKSSKPEFKFTFEDDGYADCSLYISKEGDWWEEIDANEELSPNIEYYFNPSLENISYYWKIKCIDEDGNVEYSPQYFVDISANEQNVIMQDNQEEVETTYNVIQNVYNVIPDFETYSPDEKKIVDYLKMDALIKDAKRKLEMANRDLFNLKNQPDTDSVIKTRDEIYARIETIKDETPLSVSSKKKVDFVKYIEDSEVESLFNEYLTLNNIQLSNSEKKKLVEQNKILQKKATIATTAYNVEITYISGRKEEITLIVRKTDIDSAQGIMYAEFIPKDIVDTVNKIVFVTQPDKILKEDPVFEVELTKFTEIVYYIKNSVSLDIIPKIKPILIKTQLETSSNSITGFALFDTLGFSESNKKIFIIELFVVFILLGIYLFYYFKSSNYEIIAPVITKITKEESKQAIQSKITFSKIGTTAEESHKIQYINNVIQKAENNLKHNKIEAAAVKYYELKFLYDLLSENDKLFLFDNLMSLSDKINYANINKLLDEAIIFLAIGNYDSSIDLYEEIQKEYAKLSDYYQEKIYARCCELALHLQMKQEKNG